MGMFDSLYSPAGSEYQTKALARVLDRYQVGDAIELDAGDALRDVTDYQMKVYSGSESGMVCATVERNLLAQVPAPRDESLPLLDYFGGWLQ